jgi:hypothetical protein
MSRAEFAELRFRVSEGAEGQLFLSPLEGGPKTNTVLNSSNLLSLGLKAGTNMEEAEQLARHLNKYVTHIGITFLP